MADGTRSPYLGPHVVGQRVVVRRVVPGETGPTGGPAFTDVLGTCLSWDPCVVETATGTRVVIPLTEIVSGKPVPPRPSVRLRASVAECESHVATLWSSVTVTPAGAWQVRSSTSVPRKRANSCLAIVDPGLPLAEAVAAVRRLSRTGEPLLHVEADSSLEADLRALGSRPAGGESDFMLASLSRALRAAGRPTASADLSPSGNHASASIGGGCDPIAEAQATVDGDWLGIHEVLVDPGHRRQGLGRAVVAGLLAWGVEQGARTAWLHVESDNVAARALYESLGFVEHHRMRYLTLPD
jgi:GNAT superfamily N-acetyltransferase